MTPNTEQVAGWLEVDGPLPSSSILRRIEKGGVSPAAARKRLQRLGEVVKRLKGCGLPNNEQLLYLEGQWCGPRFHDALKEAWTKHSSAHGHALNALRGSHGVSTLHQFETRCGAPFALRKQLSTRAVLDQLQRLLFVETVERPTVGTCVQLIDPVSHQPQRNMDHLKATLIAESVLLSTVSDWIRKLGLASYDATSTRDDNEQPNFSQYAFDIVGPSYTRPLASLTKGQLKPGFLVADVWIGAELSTSNVGGFIRKCNVIRALPNSRPFMAMLIADRFEKQAWRLGRQSGLLFLTPELLFGAETAKALQELVATLTNAARAVAKDPHVVSRLFAALGKVEGAAANLRGPLFEIVVAYTLQQVEGGTVKIGQQFTTTSGDRAEVDVLLDKPEIVTVCECRGHGPGVKVTLETVKKWCTVSIPRVRACLKSNSNYWDKDQRYYFWTTGQLSDGAREYLQRRSDSTKKYEILYLEGPGVLAYVRRARSKRLVDTLNEHYFRHPLARVSA